MQTIYINEAELEYDMDYCEEKNKKTRLAVLKKVNM